MKKLVLTITAFGLFYSSNIIAQTEMNNNQVQQSIQQDQEWQPADEQRFQGANNMWYTIEGDQVMQSKNGQNWEMVSGNTFQTEDGNMYRYYQGKLYKLADGQTWKLTDSFTDKQGQTYTFDQQGNLMTRD
ncbi:MAG: hypothetical protein M3Q58_08270 [Bacteroidota bacterium]|nr:hypothetical protein [Bacteroidota bacterium]